MTRNVVASGAFALALLAASAAHAAADADLEQIRDEIRQMKESYEARIRALEQRLQDAEARTAGATASAPAQPVAPSAASAPAPAPVAAASPSGGPTRYQRVQSRDFGGAAGRLRQPVAGSE